MGVEAVLQPEQHLGRLAALAAPDDVAEVVESFDAGSGDDQRLGGRIVMRGERVRRASAASCAASCTSERSRPWP
jgi:hypothetical protein